MTAKEREEWEAYKADKEKKEAAERRKAARVTYQQLVDEELAQVEPGHTHGKGHGFQQLQNRS